ncbi:hypothetical protein GCM10012319_16350 [Comamonas sp. KCTC 72670]|nr:hypothetical protein GCM10012319_16350 [Comamonas sp. KCTC 72670]
MDDSCEGLAARRTPPRTQEDKDRLARARTNVLETMGRWEIVPPGNGRPSPCADPNLDTPS